MEVVRSYLGKQAFDLSSRLLVGAAVCSYSLVSQYVFIDISALMI